MSQSGHTEEKTHSKWAALSGIDALPEPKMGVAQVLWAFILGLLEGVKICVEEKDEGLKIFRKYLVLKYLIIQISA